MLCCMCLILYKEQSSYTKLVIVISWCKSDYRCVFDSQSHVVNHNTHAVVVFQDVFLYYFRV